MKTVAVKLFAGRGYFVKVGARLAGQRVEIDVALHFLAAGLQHMQRHLIIEFEGDHLADPLGGIQLGDSAVVGDAIFAIAGRTSSAPCSGGALNTSTLSDPAGRPRATQNSRYRPMT